MLRRFRRSDAVALFDLTGRYFPEEGELLRWRPGAVSEVVQHAFRPDIRFVVWLLAAVHRPVFRAFALEADGRMIGGALLTFPRNAGYISSVVVDAPYRRRGYAEKVVRACEATARRMGKRYAVLDVLKSNAPARALYAKLGYRFLRDQSYFVRDVEGPDPGATAIPSTLRGYEKSDGAALAALARRLLPPEVAEVLPPDPRSFAVAPLVATGLKSETVAWVVDGPSGPQGFVRATSSSATESGHLTAPVLAPELPEATGRLLVRTAAEWLYRQGIHRAVCEVPLDNAGAVTALAREGFREAIPLETLYRPLSA